MPRIGCTREAIAALELHLKYGHDMSRGQSRDGFTLVGRSGRSAYLSHKSNVVYKCERNSNGWESQAEYAAICSVRHIKLDGWAFPYANLITVSHGGITYQVFAAEYIKHEPMPDDRESYYGGLVVEPDEKARVRRLWNISDLHDGNVHRRGGIKYIIDAGNTYA